MTAPTGIEPQVIATIPVGYEERTNTHYQEIEIVPDEAKIQVKEVL